MPIREQHSPVSALTLNISGVDHRQHVFPNLQPENRADLKVVGDRAAVRGSLTLEYGGRSFAEVLATTEISLPWL